jgi:hypothetical protein
MKYDLGNSLLGGLAAFLLVVLVVGVLDNYFSMNDNGILNAGLVVGAAAFVYMKMR